MYIVVGGGKMKVLNELLMDSLCSTLGKMLPGSPGDNVQSKISLVGGSGGTQIFIRGHNVWRSSPCRRIP